MFSDHLILQGKRGVQQLEQWGPYAVIVNRRLYEAGHAGKYTVVNVKERWVDSVHPNLRKRHARLVSVILRADPAPTGQRRLHALGGVRLTARDVR